MKGSALADARTDLRAPGCSRCAVLQDQPPCCTEGLPGGVCPVGRSQLRQGSQSEGRRCCGTWGVRCRGWWAMGRALVTCVPFCWGP